MLLGLAIVIAGLLFPAWKAKAGRHGQDSAEPFRIAGDFYFVGASDVSVFLLTGPEGHVVLDAGYDSTEPMIAASIAKLGVDITKVKAILSSSPRPDTAGGLAALQRASGAAIWASERNAGIIAAGGYDQDLPLPFRAAMQLGIVAYPPARVDHRVGDGDTIRIGSIALTAHITGGGTRACTSWSFPVRDGDRVLNVVSACAFDVVLGMRYPGQGADLERSFRVLRGLPADIWVTSHGRAWGRYRKFVASTTATDPVDPFIDPEGYKAYIDHAEADFRAGVVH